MASYVKIRVKKTPNHPDGVAWQARWRDPSGRQRSRNGFKTQTAAKAFIRELEQQLEAGVGYDPKAGRVLLRDYIEDTLDPAKNPHEDLRPKTLTLYRSVVRNWIDPTLGERPLNAITRNEIVEAYASWRRQGLGAPTEMVIHRVLSKTFTRAADIDEILFRNPYRKIPLRQAPSARKPKLSIEQIHAVAEAIGPRYRALILVMGQLGLRVGECAYLRRHHIDLEAGELRVEGSDDGPTKTESSNRVVSIPPSLGLELKRHLQWHVGNDDEARVFTSPRGLKLDTGHFRMTKFRPACLAAGVAHLDDEGRYVGPSPHTLRHSAATNALYSAGLSQVEVQRLLGHASIATTANTYMSPDAADRQRTAAKLEALYGEAGHGS